jgi:outer membrane protein assembly factor BamB
MDPNAVDLFLVKFAPDGAHVWTQIFGDVKNQRGPGLAVDAAGNIYLAGTFGGALNFPPGGPECELTDKGAGEDLFVVKLDPMGKCEWAKSYGNDLIQYAQAMQVDSEGNVAVVGEFVGDVNFGKGVISGTGDRDAFVLMLDKDGETLWSERFGGPDLQGAQVVVFDGSGGLIVAGRFAGSVDFGVGPILTSESGKNCAYLVKLDVKTGTSVWRRGFGKTGVNESRGLVLDGAGNAVFMATTTGSLDLGGGPLATSGAISLVLAKFKL